MKISIKCNDIELEASIKDTETGQIIYNSLPIKTRVEVWGNELYFEIPEYIDLEADAIAEVEPGSLAYWPTGRCFCIFWGPTPLSTDEMPVAAGAVNVFGSIEGDLSLLNTFKQGSTVSIKKS